MSPRKNRSSCSRASAASGERRAAPLAERMRPRRLDEMVGQPQLLAPGAGLRALVDAGTLPSLILWGPPGSGKTTIARLLAEAIGAHFEPLSAVTAGVKEIRAVVDRAQRQRGRTVLFLDEIHRLNRAQQDTLLPHVERGSVTLIGATTENPSFEVIAPLLSRCRVFVLERLDEEALAAVVRRAAADPERGLGGRDRARRGRDRGDRARRGRRRAARARHPRDGGGDRAAERGPEPARISLEAVREAVGRRTLLHDRDREEHYNLASAFIKSLRASDPDAALYYAARLLAAGDDLLFLARRLVIFASEDVGNADPSALGVATAAYLAAERVGLPEGRIPLAQAITHLACAPKSNAAYRALGRALRGGRAARLAAGAAAPAQRADPAPGAARLRPRVHLSARRTRCVRRAQQPPRGARKGDLLRAHRVGRRGRAGRRLAAWRRRRDEEDRGLSDVRNHDHAKPRWLCNDCARSKPP